MLKKLVEKYLNGNNKIIFTVQINIKVLIRISFRKIEKALKPFLNFLGVGEKASTIAVVGVTLGIGFGAGLLIKEVKTGKLHYKDVFGVLVLVGMLHSIIEDTAVISLIGSNIIITLFLRAVLTLCIVYVFMRLGAHFTKEFWQKHLTNYNIPEYKPNS